MKPQPLSLLLLLVLTGCQTAAYNPQSSPTLASSNPVSEPPVSQTIPPADTATPPEPINQEMPKPGTPVPNPASTEAPYTRRPYQLTDQVPSNSDFAQFRQKLTQAIQNRDAEFIKAIATSDITITFGLPKTLDDLEIDNPKAMFWQELERVMSVGCTPYEAPSEDAVEVEAWNCPHVSQAALGDPFTDVYIVAQGVNVRSQPKADSPVVGVLSHEVVKSYPTGFEQMTEQQRQEMQTLNGWQPVVTPDGKVGYVSSRYAFTPAGYRARFEKLQGQWRMTVFISGD